VTCCLMLHEQTGDVPAHVRVQLRLEFRHLPPVPVPHHGGRLVNAPSPGGKDPVPHFGVVADAGGTWAESFIEAAHPDKSATPQTHGSSGAESPDGNAVPPMGCIPVMSVVAAVEA